MEAENQSLDTSVNMGDDYNFDMDLPQESLEDLTDMEDHGI
jgi:hypothetical protein